MKKSKLLLTGLFIGIFFSCSPLEKKNSIQKVGELETVKIDLSEAREGELSEFFESEIEYIWLKDDSEEAQLNAGLQKIFFHADKIFTLDIFGCRCIKIFDRAGYFLSEIRAYGEGPEKYFAFDDAIVVNEEVLLLGVFPTKLMWFSQQGDFLREEKLDHNIGSGVFSEAENRYYFYSEVKNPDDYFVKSIDKDFLDTLKFHPFRTSDFHVNYPNRNNFIKNGSEIYLGRPFQDTIWMVSKEGLLPKFVFDYGKYAQNIEVLKRNSMDLDPLQELEFINTEAKLYFVPNQWFLTDSQLYSGFKFENEFYNIIYDRRSQTTHVLKRRIKDDIHLGYSPHSFTYQFENEKVGFKIPGKELFEFLRKIEVELGPKAFQEYVVGKGKKFSELANEAQNSENPILLVYTAKE